MSTKTNTQGWYTVEAVGLDPKPKWGPYRSAEAACAAVDRFYSKYGADAGTYLAAGSARILGPFETREQAEAADISTCGAIYLVL